MTEQTRRPVLGIDPSSSCTGYAIMYSPTVLVECGNLRPIAGDEVEARSMAMCDMMNPILREHAPGVIVFEMASKAGGWHSNKSGARLQSLAFAIGALYRHCYVWTHHSTSACRLVSVRPEQWTGGRPKQQRAAAIGLQFPAYRAAAHTDRGGDAADAIGLALWHFKTERTVDL